MAFSSPTLCVTTFSILTSHQLGRILLFQRFVNLVFEIMERWQGRVALVTGASAGIGYSVTKALAEKGMKVVACARNIAAVEKLGEELSEHPGSVKAVKCDVSKEEEVTAMFQMIRQDSSLGRVDVCINNAGLSYDTPLLTGDPAQWKHMFDVNVLGLMMVTKEAFQLMQDNNIDDGHIILINSTAGKAVKKVKAFHCYSATKFAVSAITEGLRQELRELKSNIRISQVCPGLVRTEIVKRAFGDDQQAEAFYSDHKHIHPNEIVDCILYILDSPPHVEVNDVVITALGDDL